MADNYFVIEPANNLSKDANRLPDVFEVVINKKVQELLQKGLIRKSTSEWSGAVFILPKKTSPSGAKWSDFRLLIDYRGLNEATLSKQPSIPATLNRLLPLLQGEWYSVIDCRADLPCHPYPIAEKDRDKTAFTTSTGIWEWNYVPYGLRNASRSFKLTMSKILLGLQGRGVVAYGDFVIVSSHDFNSNQKKLEEVFQQLLKSGLKPFWPGCVFATHEIKILGL